MKDKEEFVQARPGAGKSWLIIILLYVLFLLWLESIIDFFLGLAPPGPDPDAIQAYNQQKAYVSNIIFGVGRSLPILLFLWFGYRVLTSQQLPPPRTPVPVTLRLIKGPHARMYGMFIVGLSLLLLLRELKVFSGAG